MSDLLQITLSVIIVGAMALGFLVASTLLGTAGTIAAVLLGVVVLSVLVNRGW